MTGRHEAGWVPDTGPAGRIGRHRSTEELVALTEIKVCGFCADLHIRRYPERPGYFCHRITCQCWCARREQGNERTR